MTMRVADFFCGLGGWSKGFYQAGFQVMGIDIIDVGYPYPLLLQDIRKLRGSMFQTFDVIVGSPECRDFSRAGIFGKTKWRIPPNPERGLELVRAFLRIIKVAKPKYWLMENVPRLQQFLSLKPRCIVNMTPTMKRALYGDFPNFLVPMELSKPKQYINGGKLRPWLRAKIPLCVSLALAQAILTDQKSKGD